MKLTSVSVFRSGAILILAITAGMACVSDASSRPLPTAARPIGDSIGTANAGIANQRFNCVIEPFQAIKLSPQAIGVVGELYVDRGAYIRKGQLLGKLVDDVERANLALARTRSLDTYSIGAQEAKLVYLRARQDRLSTLIAKGYTTQTLYEEVVSDVHVTEQQLAQARLAQQVAKLEVVQNEKLLEQKEIRSPFDGYVSEVLLHPGEFRDDKTAIFKLAQIDPLRVEVFIPTRYFGRVRRGAWGKVSPERPMTGTFLARVDVADSVVDAASGTFGVRLLMANPRRIVPAGLQCDVRF